jgi:hypothetical protein
MRMPLGDHPALVGMKQLIAEAAFAAELLTTSPGVEKRPLADLTNRTST